MGFYRAIARSLGVSINLSSKAQQLRNRVEDVLQRGDLMVIFGEAHYLWPQCNHREALPARINWIMTALVNYGVSAALVTTPQFTRAQQLVEKRTRRCSWAAAASSEAGSMSLRGGDDLKVWIPKDTSFGAGLDTKCAGI